MRLLVLQHVDCEHPGRLRAYLQEEGIAWDAVSLDRVEPIPALEPYDALWVMGGPMDVWDTDTRPWMIEEKRAIRRWVRGMGRPFLGICLGHQLLGDALGGTCGPQVPPEIGILDVTLTQHGLTDPLFRGMPDRFNALQWHSVAVRQPPEGAEVLANSPICGCQAMRVGKCAWGLQYHVEIEETTVSEWAAIPAYSEALKRSLGSDALERMQAAARSHLPQLAAHSEQLFQNFLHAVRS